MMYSNHFEQLVAEALDSIPADFQRYLENVAVVIEPWPTQYQLSRVGVRAGGLLLGLYEGIPRPRRPSALSLVPPDKITIFQGCIEFLYPDTLPDRDTAIRDRVRRVVLHEVAHHFGFGEERLRELGLG